MTRYLIILLSIFMLVPGCTNPSQFENVGEAQQELSASANLVFTISDMYLSSSGWGENGTVFCDAQNRCISDHTSSSNAGVGIVHFSGLPECVNLTSATLNFSTTEWDSIVPKAEIRRVLRPITIPSSCPSTSMLSSHVGWRYATAGVPWTQLGAHGIGTDVSSESTSVSVGYGGNISHSVDVTSIVSTCVSSGTCDLAMFSVLDAGQTSPSHHFWLIVGSPTLVFTCDNSSSSSSSTTTTSSTTVGSGGAGGSSTSSTGGSCE